MGPGSSEHSQSRDGRRAVGTKGVPPSINVEGGEGSREVNPDSVSIVGTPFTKYVI